MKDMLNTLVKRSFAASKVRNLIAVLAIALTGILFTSVTTIAMGTMESMTLTMQLQKGSKSDGDFRNMTAGQFESLKQADFIRQAGQRMPVGFLTNTNRHNIEFDVLDEVQAELTFCNPSHGIMPDAPNEIVASDRALRELGAEPEIGAQVTIEFTVHGQEYRLPMVVSGWYEAANDQTSMMAAGTAFCREYPDIFQYTYDSDREIAGTYWSDFVADSTVGLQEKMDEFSRSVGGDPDDLQSDHYLPGIINTMTNPAPDPKMMAAGAAFVVLFILCGYLLIYNVFDIAVMREIRRYGLYRTIGMSRGQVKKLINRQALLLSCLGVPAGLIGGFFIGRAALPVVMSTLSVEYRNIAVDVSPSPVIFLGAAALTFFTVYLSTRKPVRVAANTPPLEAFRYVESSTGKKKVKRSSISASLPRLAWSNLGRSRRRSVFIIVSLMLCVVLLNCVGTAASSLDIEKQVAYMIRTDFAVVNTATSDGMKGFTNREQALKQKTMKDIAARPGVTEGNPVYKNTLEDTDVTYDFGISFANFSTDTETGLNRGITEDGFWFGLGDDGKPICNVYGMEEASIARMDIQEGETDVRVLYEKMKHGEGVLLGIQADRQTMKIDETFDFLNIGDEIKVYKNGQPVMNLPVLAKAATNGDDEEIGFTVGGSMKVGGDGVYLYLPASVYRELYDQPSVYKYSFNAEPNQREDVTAFLNDYMENVDNSITFLSADSARANAEGTRDMINFVGGLVGIIFGIAGVLNLMNTLITTVLTRRHEFATMQSIGMTSRQLRKMMMFEGVYYALGACSLGVIASVILNLTLVRSITGGIWYFTFRFTLLPAMLTSGVLLIVSVIVPVLALKVFNRGSIVEQLRVTD
ncbi:ABC transporter permease [Ruminococcus sp. OA3]|uniref:ABC transporter permease n=1 Tax=Ruminococcus sp. OA3 TaxID=2914164 RepID=UPI001F06FB75|nr:ABC transporter permease [Ruminococcus sp. OA3]MCH1982862.1 ABC transporter permease [Ruminococcus sp. OA3]